MGDIGHVESRAFPLIQTKPVPKGDDAWESMRAAVINKLTSKIPEEYYIPQRFIDDPPQDVTHIPRDCGLLTDEELDITENYDATSLARAIATRKFTAVEVATAFCKRAVIAHQISCCLTQWFPEDALEQARALDEHLERTGKTIGPLHGVPISIKEHIPIKGRSSSAGYVSTTVEDSTDAHMVEILRELGAVFYVKTMQPQSVMHLESDSHMGRVLNPYNIYLSAGGSSGGEAALIALGGSVMGVGTDIGGSVRCPAAFCGLYGFKPTAYTLPTRDYSNGGFPAELNILCSIGPLCRSLRDMDLFVREVLEYKPYLQDPRLVPIPWTGLKTPALPRPLKIGVMWSDGLIRPQPPVTRALEWAYKQLESSPLVELRSFVPYQPAKAIHMIRKMYWPDGGIEMKEALGATGEPMHPLSHWIIKDAECKNQRNATEISKMRVRRDAFRCAFADNWNEQDVDVVLCPVFVGPACAHDTAFYWNYTSLWNFVDYPGAVFPTPIKARKSTVETYSATEALSEQDKHVRSMWEEGDFEGAPINLQLVARKHHDNLLFGSLELLKDSLDLR